MADETPPTTTGDERPRLRVLPTEVTRFDVAPRDRPRTIGRLIAQTALIADSAATRTRIRGDVPSPRDARDGHGPRGFFSRFR